MQGYAGKPGFDLQQGGEFAYLQLDKLDLADVALDATVAHAATLLQLRYTATAPIAESDAPLQCIARDHDWLLVLCASASETNMAQLRALAAQEGVNRLIVVTTRPKAVAQWLADAGIEAQTLSIRAVLTQGQESKSYRQA